MCAFTGASGALRQAEFFVYREADRRMLEAALERHADGAPVEPTTWIRASAADAALVRDARRPRDGDARLGERLPHLLQVHARRAAAGRRGLPRRGAGGGRRRPPAAAAPGGHDPRARGVRAPVRRGGAAVCAARRGAAAEVPHLRHDGPRPAATRTSRGRARCRGSCGAARARASRRRISSSTRTTTRISSSPTAWPRSRPAARGQRDAARQGRAHRQRAARGRAAARCGDGLPARRARLPRR